MSGPRYDLVPHKLPEATPLPPEQAARSTTEAWNEAHASEPWCWGKILFSAGVAILTGILVATGANSAPLHQPNSSTLVQDCARLMMGR